MSHRGGERAPGSAISLESQELLCARSTVVGLNTLRSPDPGSIFILASLPSPYCLLWTNLLILSQTLLGDHSLKHEWLNRDLLHCTARRGFGLNLLRGLHRRNFCWSAITAPFTFFIDAVASRDGLRKKLSTCDRQESIEALQDWRRDSALDLLM